MFRTTFKKLRADFPQHALKRMGTRLVAVSILEVRFRASRLDGVLKP
jgi:hypothetical protein